MKLLFLDMNQIKDREALYGRLREKLYLPDYFGQNLDALHDVLTEGRISAAFIFENCALASDEMKEFLEKLRPMAEQLGAENEKLIFRFFA